MSGHRDCIYRRFRLIPCAGPDGPSPNHQLSETLLPKIHETRIHVVRIGREVSAVGFTAAAPQSGRSPGDVVHGVSVYMRHKRQVLKIA